MIHTTTHNESGGINWLNINLNSPYERSQNFLDGYDFDTLLLEVEHNCRIISRESIKAQAINELKNKYNTALEILEANLDNILKEALTYRESE